MSTPVWLMVVGAFLSLNPAMAQDLSQIVSYESKVYLDRFWIRGDTLVTISGENEVRLAEIKVHWPRYMRKQQRNFSVEITNFAALAHPGFQIAKFKQLGLPVWPDTESNEERLEMLWSARLKARGQKLLDESLGEKKSLLLVNVVFQRGPLFVFEPPVKDDKRIARIEACVFSRRALPQTTIGVLRKVLQIDARRDEFRTVYLEP